MRILKISFSKPRDFKIFSYIIRHIDNKPFSHVSISWYSDFLEREVVYQASNSAVNFIEGVNFASTHIILDSFQISATDTTFRKVIQFAMDNVGRPYGVKQIIGIGIVKLMSLFGKRIRNPFRDGALTYVCCELVAKILVEEFGYSIDEDLDTITPGELYNLLKKYPCIGGDLY